MCIRCSQDECVQCQVHSSLQEISNPFNKSEVLKTCRCDKKYKYDKKANICGKRKNDFSQKEMFREKEIMS